MVKFTLVSSSIKFNLFFSSTCSVYIVCSGEFQVIDLSFFCMVGAAFRLCSACAFDLYIQEILVCMYSPES